MDNTVRFHWLLTTPPPYEKHGPGNDTFEWMHVRKVQWPLSHSPSATVTFAPNHDPTLRHPIIGHKVFM